MNYELLIAQLKALSEQERHYVSLLANASALLYDAMDDLNWAGFYLMRGGRLALGPFQGKVACVHIDLGRGVCGTAALENRTLRVPDVHAFPGHIACDGASNSEIVIPLHARDAVVGVLDIDSPRLNRFSAEDEAGLTAFAQALETLLVFDDSPHV